MQLGKVDVIIRARRQWGFRNNKQIKYMADSDGAAAVQQQFAGIADLISQLARAMAENEQFEQANPELEQALAAHR